VLRVEDKAASEAAFLKKYGGIEQIAAQSDLDRPFFSINQMNANMDQFAEQSAEVMKATAERAAHEALIKNFMIVARHGRAMMFTSTFDTMCAIAKELEKLGY
jgi:hypothetical protein